MASIVHVNTYTHSVTYVTDQMLRSLKLLVTLIGLDQTKFIEQWPIYERGVKTWLESGHLQTVILEVSHPSHGLVTRCDFSIDYGYGNGDGSMWVDTEALKYSITKIGVIPAQCNYSVSVLTAAGRPSVEGWGTGTLLPTTNFIKQSLGTTIGTHAIGAQAGYWRKIS